MNIIAAFDLYFLIDNYFKLLILCIVYLAVPVVTATSSCANLLVHQTNTGGIIQTGDYLGYRNNMDCSWNISANTMLQLEFLRFHISDSNDYLLVYDGGSSSSPLIAKFNNASSYPLTPLPAPVTSSTNKLYVRFVSDASNTVEGILARYHGIVHIKKPCNKSVTRHISEEGISGYAAAG